MKKKVRILPSNPFYSDEPAVSKTQIASKPPVPNGNLANRSPSTVDKHPGQLSGVAGFVSKKGPRHGSSGITAPKIGAPTPQQGKLRSSGHPSAHRIGSRSK